VLACIVFPALLIALALLLLKVWRLTRNLNAESINEFKSRYLILTERLKDSSISKLVFFWKLIYLVRWFLTTLVLLLMRELPAIQIISLLILSVAWQMMIYIAWPYDSNSTNIILLTNEVTVSVYIYIIFLMTDFLETITEASAGIDHSHMRETLSLLLTSILMLIVFLNSIYTFYQIAIRLIAYCRRVRERNTEELRLNSITYRQKYYTKPV
jgi:hypothetical protein